jgi:hypothetical protein
MSSRSLDTFGATLHKIMSLSFHEPSPSTAYETYKDLQIQNEV